MNEWKTISHDKELSTITHSSVGESHKHNVESEMPNSKEYIVQFHSYNIQRQADESSLLEVRILVPLWGWGRELVTRGLR